MIFSDRHEAGSLLAKKLSRYRGMKDAVVMAIPRGGLEIGLQIARELNLPLDIAVTKKIPYPGDPEFAMGAASAEDYIVEQEYRGAAGEEYLQNQVAALQARIRQVYDTYRKGMKKLSVKGKTVILCDDGLATGQTAQAACRLLARQGAAKVIVAVPVAPQDTLDRLREEAEVVCLYVPETFFSIGEFYRLFPQLSDKEAIQCLREANKK